MAKSYKQRRSRLQEKRMAEDVSGRVQAGSGSSWRAKSDVRVLGKLRCEAKFTEKSSYSLKLDELLKIKDEAIIGGLEIPVMQVEFVIPGAYGSMKYAIMDYTLFRQWHDPADKALNQETVYTDHRSTKLSLHDINLLSGRSAAANQHWCLQIAFGPSTPAPKVFAVIDWHLFTSLYEEHSA